MTAVGTPMYAAPELMRGDAYDEKIDVYSFGVLLLYVSVSCGLNPLLLGRWKQDFPTAQVPEMRRIMVDVWHRGWRPIDTAALDKGIPFAPPSVVALVERCMDHDPARRPCFHDVLTSLCEPILAEVEGDAYGRWRGPGHHETDAGKGGGDARGAGRFSSFTSDTSTARESSIAFGAPPPSAAARAGPRPNPHSTVTEESSERDRSRGGGGGGGGGGVSFQRSRKASTGSSKAKLLEEKGADLGEPLLAPTAEGSEV